MLAFRGDVERTQNQSRFSHPDWPPRDVLAVQFLQPPTKTLKTKPVDRFSLSKAVRSANKPQFHVGIINKVGTEREEKVMTSLRLLKRTKRGGGGGVLGDSPALFMLLVEGN